MNPGSQKPLGVRRALLDMSNRMRQQKWLRSLYTFLLPRDLRHRLNLTLVNGALQEARTSPAARWIKRPVGIQSAPVRVFANNVTYAPSEGVNIFAYLRGQFGLGESARMYARALIGAGYPVALVDVDINLPHGMDDRSLDAYIGDDVPHYVSVLFINPDYFQAALTSIGEAKLRGKYVIACWFWELENVPQEWFPAIDLVDEILVASRFVQDAFRRVTDKPILCVPLPLSEVGDSGLTREDFGLPTDKFIFLNSFDFNSWIARKNPAAAVESFLLAFDPSRDDVMLLLKTSNGFRNPHRLLELMEIARNDPRILVRDEILAREDVQALQRCCDAYVSLHHSEGFGLGMAECMHQGKPVIGTAWSANMDFMDETNSCLVDYSLVPVREGEYAHHEGQQWAEADRSDAARHMRRLVDDKEYAAQLARNAARDIRMTLAPEAAAAAIIARVREVLRQRAMLD